MEEFQNENENTIYRDTSKGDGNFYADYVIVGSDGADQIHIGGSDSGEFNPIWGGAGKDIFIVSPDFHSDKRAGTVILDFEPNDKIDLSSLSIIKSLKDIKTELFTLQERQFTVTPERENNKISLYNEEVSGLGIPVTIINLGQDKELAIANIKPEQLLEQYFIFARDVTLNDHLL